MAASTPIYVGTSGWYYDHWEGLLYPKGLPKARRFEVYAKRYRAVEVNATYYRYPSEAMVQGWYRKAPPGFLYVVKVHRDITHRRKLRDVREPLARFLDSVQGLREKLAGYLVQLPPSLKQDLALLEEFLQSLPEPQRFAFEFRHASWENEETLALLDGMGAGHVVVSRKGYPFFVAHCGSMVYYRLHGPERLYASSYDDEWLRALAEKLVGLAQGNRPSFVFFNNDVGGHAVRNADRLNQFVSARLRASA